MNKYVEEIEIYPNDTKNSEKDYYKPKILIGKQFEYKYGIKEHKEK